jgi:antirestriction protein ArdC
LANKQRRDIYQEVTDRVLEILERGVVPWKNPIRRRANGDGWPKNLTSGKRYRGINIFLLTFMAWHAGYQSDYWLTFRQAKETGGGVRKGEKSSLVTFWKLYEKTDAKTCEPVQLPCLRHYHVFNIEQCDGVEIPDIAEIEPLSFTPIESAEQIIAGYRDPPVIRQAGNRACYRPASDTIEIAPREQFRDIESYYATLFHEAAHSTGHEKRLARQMDEPQPFGSPDYSREELVAEMAAGMLCGQAGIADATIEQTASYIDHWKAALRGDKRLVINAASAGQKAADWILGASWPEPADS